VCSSDLRALALRVLALSRGRSSGHRGVCVDRRGLQEGADDPLGLRDHTTAAPRVLRSRDARPQGSIVPVVVDALGASVRATVCRTAMGFNVALIRRSGKPVVSDSLDGGMFASMWP